ncbi:carbohydrate ABC transporter membrane protein 1 (CUT1 family) [Nonomuraea fuscirosea]|jgi:multiple sugar transport system permease protein|uniref:Carbohydrate ABC transporter membrane protein 1 (CUT1 family) n=1 Tax=Nonomuraea fuscirosea TaxID=1291556 RepID=A0A2T0M467_9ACTN|nr:sugar ABC transporter permease [Nonomuraea fuscirosea]PRX51683.1 carbohydrate ABC transporter membrane protein 1 (CUT1 family) [Nonomuraea fuscirosea]WSA49930.1 sugar ABC transporter permease [Nonomuraea fuscirosea]
MTEVSVASGPAGGGHRSTQRSRREARAAYLFLAPWFVGLLVITIGPIFASLYLSFTDYSLLEEAKWVGLDNYTKMFTEDPRFLNSLQVTTIYVIVSVPLQLAFALALALVLDRGLRGLPIYRSIFYLPSLLGGSVAIAILWRKVFGADGLVNAVLSVFGIQGTGWVGHPDYALGTLILLHVWTFGAPMIIFLAGLRQIPSSYYEAAAVDGAGALRQFRSITLPLLTPIIFFNLVLELIKSFQSFTQAFIVSGGRGGPADSTLFYTLYLYLQGFKNYDMGYAAAMAWVLLLIIAGLTGVNFLASKYWVFYGDTK